MRHTAFVAFLIAIVLFVPAPDAMAAFGGAPAPPAPSAAVPNVAVTETIRLTYAKPSVVIRTLRQDILDPGVKEPKSGIPAGIRRLSHDDTSKTITVSGSAGAIADLKALLLLMDAKPVYVEIKTRLIRISLGEDGARQETVVEAPTLTVENNRPASVSVVSPLKKSLSFSVTPHLGGDKSVVVNAVTSIQNIAAGPFPQRIRTSVFTSSLWLTRSTEWKPLREISLVDDQQLQKAVLTGVKPPAEVYPLYRWEISASERIDTTSP